MADVEGVVILLAAILPIVVILVTVSITLYHASSSSHLMPPFTTQSITKPLPSHPPSYNACWDPELDVLVQKLPRFSHFVPEKTTSTPEQVEISHIDLLTWTVHSAHYPASLVWSDHLQQNNTMYLVHDKIQLDESPRLSLDSATSTSSDLDSLVDIW